MFQIGDQVVYGTHGVCSIVSQEDRVINRKRVSYYVLEPAAQKGAQYLVPAQNQAALAKLRKILTREELAVLFQHPDIRRDIWISQENLRKQTFREKISGGDRMALMQMICTLYRHRTEQQAVGKKIHQADEGFLRDAEKLLAGEIAVVLDIDIPQAIGYLREQLNVNK